MPGQTGQRLDASAIAALAAAVDGAAVDRVAIAQLADHTPLCVEDAYAVQQASVARRLARGERQIGIKLGFTSRAKMRQMGVDTIIWGPVTDAMVREEGGEVALADFIHPRVEPEVCFLIGKTIDRPLTLIELGRHVEAVAPAIEIIDSRYRDFRFSLPDVVADNCSSAGLVIGGWQSCPADMGNLGVVLCDGAEAVQIGSTAAVLGHPLRALAMATRLCAAAGQPIGEGTIVMSGGATSAEPLRAGAHVSARIHGLGQAEFTASPA